MLISDDYRTSMTTPHRPSLIVFIGKPGVGKSTIIQRVFPKTTCVDVMPFVKKYEIDGIVPEEKTILGYQEMYQSLSSQFEREDQFLILELGTNHPELNIQELVKISEKASLCVFLCIASIDVCRTRSRERGRAFDMDALERRLQRSFPESHLALLKDSSINYRRLDMELPLEDNVEIVNSVLNNLRK